MCYYEIGTNREICVKQAWCRNGAPSRSLSDFSPWVFNQSQNNLSPVKYQTFTELRDDKEDIATNSPPPGPHPPVNQINYV